MQITSRDNSLLRKAREVRDGKEEDLIYIEGLRLAEEALNSQLAIEAVVISDELAQKPKVAELLRVLQRVSQRFALVSEKLLESISYTKTPQGIVVLAQHPPVGVEQLDLSQSDNPLFVVLHEINNPVNVGAVLRTAEAAGARGVITTRNTSDPFSPKSLRGAMGSAFRLPIWTGAELDQVLEWCRRHSIKTIGTDATASLSHTELDWTGATALVLGPESTGLTDEEIRLVDVSVRIPMHGEVESLNVSVAAGILLYEAVRQRQPKIIPPARKTP
jgi:TrmH family RNA methyltransferase